MGNAEYMGQQKAKNTFHKPNTDVMFDAFDDLEEEMIGEGVIGNGNKKSGDKISKRASVAKPKELHWSTTGREGVLRAMGMAGDLRAMGMGAGVPMALLLLLETVVVTWVGMT